MATDYADIDYAARPPATPPRKGPSCNSSWCMYICTLDRGHEGMHIADGLVARCAEWNEEEEW